MEEGVGRAIIAMTMARKMKSIARLGVREVKGSADNAVMLW